MSRVWAQKIVTRHQLGERVPAIALEYAREALNLPLDEPEPALPERPPNDGSLIE